MTTDPSPPSPLQEAANLLRAKQPEQASHVLISYLKLHPESEEAWFLLSYAIPDYERKKKSLERVLQINPENARAKERLRKLQTLSLSEPRSDSQKTRKKSKGLRNLLFGLVAIAVFGGCALGVWLAIQNLGLIIPANSPPAIAQQPETQSTNTASPQPSPTVTNTPTPDPTATPTATPQLTELVPTLVSEFPLPEGEHAQQMDDIQNQVSTIRELGILVDSPRYIVPESEIQHLLSNMFLERYSRDIITDQARVLSVLGLIKPTYNLYDQAVKSIGEGLGGFYVPWSDELFVIGEDFTGVEKFVFAHEYVHALTDQHYHLENIGVYPECLSEKDHCSAISALVEGDATALMYQWFDVYASEQDVTDVIDAQFAPLDKVITSNDIAPPYMVREMNFEYLDGQIFVEYLLDLGGWDQVNAAYQDLPLSTEQILHPEKYLSGETPIPVELLPLESILGEDWRHLGTETLGELGTQLILGYHENVLVQLDPETVQQAAAGWGGDSYQVYYRGLSNQNILVANWVWDNDAEAAEFWEAMFTYQSKRYLNKKVESSEYACWTKINDQFSCIYQTDTQTLWLVAPTMDLIGVLLDQYPEFK